MATLEDIAKKLNISKGTVSKALNGVGGVSDEMKKTILETAVEMNYSRRNRKKAGGKLCVFIENMMYQNPGDFGYDIVAAFRETAEQAGYSVWIVELDEELQRTSSYEEYMLRHGFSGALMLGLSLRDRWLLQMRESHTPAVLYDNYVVGNPNTVFLGTDNREAMELVMAHLSSLGHRKIGYLSSAMDSYVFRTRYEAFLECVQRIDPFWEESLSGNSYHTLQCVQEHLSRLLDRGVTAIVCSHDVMARLAMLHCQEMGLRVPEDVSIVGFDDLPISAFTTPPLTTVRQDRQGLGQCAFQLISGRLRHAPVSTVLLRAKLVVRASTAKVDEG